MGRKWTLSSRNTQEYLRKMEKQRQRFGLRKLTVGVASVLLGTTIVIGGSTVAHADSNSPVKPETGSSESASSSAVAIQSEKTVSLSNKQGDNAQNSEKSKSTAETTTLNSDQTQQPLTQDAVKEQKNQDGDRQVKHTEFTADKTDINSGNDITFNFNTNEAKAGDIYKVVIPETSDGFDATDSDGNGIDTVDFGQFQGDYGNGSLAYDKANKQWVLTDTFTKDNANTQPIILSTNSSFDTSKLHSTGTFKRKAYLYKNDQLLKTVEFNQKISTYVSLAWKHKDGVYSSNEAIYTTAGKEVTNKAILANTDYVWKPVISTFYPQFNHGTTLEIPMPDHFVLNTAATNNAIADLRKSYNASVTQDGNVVKINLPQLSNEQLKNLKIRYSSSLNFEIIGQFKMDVPKGDTPLASNVNPKVTQETGNNNSVSDIVNPVSVIILGQDHGLDKIPAGDIFSGNIEPDTYEYDQNGNQDTSKPVTAIENKTNHDLNKNIDIINSSPYDLSDVQATIDVPDGMDISGLSVNDTRHSFSYTFTLEDGSKQTGTFNAGSLSTLLSTTAGKKIKKVQLVFDKLIAFDSVNNFGLNGVLAKNYQDGSEVKAGNNLHTELHLTANGIASPDEPATFTQNQKIVEKIPVRPEIHNNQISASGSQTNKQPGTKNAGSIYSYASDFLNDPEKLTYYVVLPTNAVFNSADLPKNTKMSELRINGRNVVKIVGDFSRKDTSTQWKINLDNSNLITHSNLNSDYQVYVVLPDGERNNSYSALTNPDKLPFVDNSTNAYQLAWGDWNVIAATGVYPKTQAQGNQNKDLTMQGQSDDKGSSEMTFSNVLVNSESKAEHDAVIIAHVPGTDDTKSEFDFKLKGGNSAKVKNITTNQTVSQGVRIYYSTENLNLTQLNSDDSNLMTHFVSADQINDWSKVKTVMATIAEIPGDTVYGLNLDGYAPNFVRDNNKTAYASSVVWTDLLKPIVIAAGSKDSASVTITGQSTVNFKLHFNDNSQADIAIPELSHTYQDGKDTMQKTDFIKATKNSDFDDAVKNKDYTLIPKAVIDAIPNGYVLDVESGANIENSNAKYPDNCANNPAEFGKTVIYDFDGDTVVYNLVKAETFTKKIIVKRIVKFEDIDNPGVPLKPDDNKELDPVEISGTYNPLTGKVLTVNDLSDSSDRLTLAKYEFPDVLDDLIYQNANTRTGQLDQNNWTTIEVPGSILAAYINNTLNSNNNSSDTPGEMYNVSDNGVKKVTSNKVPANTFEFDQNIVIKYGLNHANLVLIGQGLGKPNQILDSSSGKNSDTDIKFKLTDADLKRDGYNYKIYYSNQQNLMDLSQDYESTEDEVVHSLSQSSLLSHVNDGTLSAYDTLADALRANGKYDSVTDGIIPAEYSQNFFVVYTPVQERKQEFYILSDNDPYRRDPVTKQFALPETTKDADKSGTDYFKMQGETGNTVLPTKTDGSGTYNALYNNGSPVNYTAGQSDYDENGNPIKHTPSVPQDDSNSYLSQLLVYQRTGYRIDKASYEYTDSQGKKHELIFTAELTKNYDPSQGLSGFYYSSDSILLPILNYLASGPSQYGGDNKLYLTLDGYTAETTPYKVKITGDEN